MWSRTLDRETSPQRVPQGHPWGTQDQTPSSGSLAVPVEGPALGNAADRPHLPDQAGAAPGAGAEGTLQG